MAPDAVEGPVRQHAQEARLKVGRHVADLVQEQRSAFGLLEAPAPHRLRAGERAALVAEELRLEQVLGHCRGVDRDEGFRRARAVAMQRARHQLLSGARFARDQHRRRGLRKPADGTEHFLHRLRLPQDLGGSLLGLFLLLLPQRLVQGAPDEINRLVNVERLGQVLERAALKRRHRRLEVRIRGHDDHRQVGMALLHLLQQLQARGPGHADVRHQHLGRPGIELGERVAGLREGLERNAFARERLLEHPADGAVVVYYPNRLHRSPIAAATQCRSRSVRAGYPPRSRRGDAGRTSAPA